MRRKIAVLSILLLLTGLSTAASFSTIHGTLYEWSTFEPLKNVIMTINTTPPQEFVAKNGSYSFNLTPGTYLIEAKYYLNNSLIYCAEENITVTGEGDYIIDLILFPSLGEDEKLFDAPNFTISEDINLTEKEEPKEESPLLSYAAITLTIAAAAIIIWYFRFRGAAPLPPVAVKISPELPEDLKQVLELIGKAGGRTTQKDLRKQLSVSEAKVSLLLTDLEDRGLIKKIKKGRGNVIILVDEKEKYNNKTENK